MTGHPAQLSTGSERTVLQTADGPISALRAGSGPAVLLLPGYTGSKEDFAPLLAPLAAAGFAVTAIDLPGQFESPGPADPSAYRPDELAAAVLAVSKDLGAPVHLLGHSFGGLVARAAVLADPSRYASLTLMCSGPGAIGGARRDVIDQLEPVLAASGMAAVYAASLAAARAEAGYLHPPAPLAAFLERRFLAGAPAMLQGMGRALRDEPDRVAELADTAVPKLVLYGADDDAWPTAVQQDMARRLSAQLAVIAGAAHSPAVENPSATVAALLAFWGATG
ncbi:MAG TPA: alpha/beta hydrolase [Jatrophihabitans sp.]|jgi:pimeloyl-ACP methyl ester carboxylesterase